MDILSQSMLIAVFEAMNKRNIASLDALVTDDLIFDFPGAGKIMGKKRVFLFLNALLRKYSSLEFSVWDSITNNNKACVCWTNKGKTSNGEDYQNSGVTVLHFKDGKIDFISDYFKDTSFTR